MPAIAEHDVTVHQGDVLERLGGMPDGSVQCIVTSPPYYGLRDYGVDGQIGLEPSPAEYVERLRAVFAEARRVLAVDGVLWLNLGDSYASKSKGSGGVSAVGLDNPTPGSYFDQRSFNAGMPDKNLLGMPWRVAFALQDDGWTLRNAVIWSKPNAMPESVTDRLSSRYEHVFLFSKSRRYWFDLDPIREPHGERTGGTAGHYGTDDYTGGTPHARLGKVRYHADGRNPGDVWTIATTPFPGAHFAVFPPDLARRCILAGCPADGTVLDPFAGSGTTLMVARQLGRKSVGIELNPAYIDLIRQRIGQTPLDFAEESA